MSKADHVSTLPAGASGSALASLSHISKTLAGRDVLRNVDLAVSASEIVTLIGPNGAGKTTLLRILLGLLPADAGTVWLKPGLKLGYMPQRLPIDETMPLPVERFLTLGARAERTRLRAVLAEVGASGLERTPIQKVSGGEFQRVLLARALLRDPDLLVLDEPAQGVDLAGQSALFELFISIRGRRGCGVLMVSHDLHLVMAATDTVVCLNHHVCCTGHPEAVSRDPAYLALFGPRAAATLALYTHHHDHVHDVGGRVVALDEADGGSPRDSDHDGSDRSRSHG